MAKISRNVLVSNGITMDSYEISNLLSFIHNSKATIRININWSCHAELKNIGDKRDKFLELSADKNTNTTNIVYEK